MDRVVLFGPPGVGKSTVSRMLVARGYYHFDGDSYSLPEGVLLNKKGIAMTPELRDREYAHIFHNLLTAVGQHERIVFDYHMMYDRYRLDLKELIPNLRWIYLTSSIEVVSPRLRRPDHLLSNLDFAKRVFLKFEEPSFPVKRVDASLPTTEVVEQVVNF